MTASGTSAQGTALTILFVDDEPAVIRAVSRVVAARTGFTIVTATSGEQALSLLRSSNIDVLVSDIDMPQMTGLELVRLARREFPTTLRILLTGAGTMDRAVNAINEGEVVRFFAKPFDVERFVLALSDLGARIHALRRERRAEAERERAEQLFEWVEREYPGTLAFERGTGGEIVVDSVRLRAYLDSAPAEIRAFAGAD
jgi:DNA-binding NtrC family response regulator